MDGRPIDELDPRELGRRLREAREARGLTQQDAAANIEAARTTVTAIEKGERRVRPEEIIKLSALYGLRVSELLRHRAPGTPLSIQLRATLQPSSPIDVEVREHVLAFERLCLDYVELERICRSPLPRRYPTPYETGTADPELAAEDAAVAERSRLGLGDGPVSNLRELLEGDIGLRIFQIPLPEKVAGMFGFTEELGGCVAVNRNHPPERRRQTLAHELAHFLADRHRSEVMLVDRYERRPASERFAEGFGRNFLMPASGLRRRFLAAQRGRPSGVTPGDLCRLAHLFFVSFEAMTRRLEELQLVRAGTWDRLSQQGFKVREAQRLLGLQPPRFDDEMLPPRYRMLAVEAWQRAEISEGQLASFLRVDRLEARRVVQELETQDSSDGERDLALDLGRPLTEVG